MTTKPPKEVSDCCGATFTESNKYPGVLVCDECHNPCYSNPSETNKADYLKEFDEFSVAKRFPDYPIISINDYVSTLSEIKAILSSSIERARREAYNQGVRAGYFNGWEDHMKDPKNPKEPKLLKEVK